MNTLKLQLTDLKIRSFITTDKKTRIGKATGNDGGYTWVG